MIMELREENEGRTPGLERRREGNTNGTVVNSLSQTLDQLQRQPSLGSGGRSPNPDRVTVSSSTIAPISKIGSVRYRECLKNHAASVGGSIFDGCGEFMPSGEEGTLEALKCVACDCHRNFHRKEVDGETQFSGNCSRRTIMLNPLQLPPPLPSPSMLHPQKYSIGMHTSPPSVIVAPMNVAYGGLSGGTESSSEDLHVFQSNAHEGVQPPPPPPFVLSKKRHRTKFTQEQKDKMLEFAEKVGWRFQRQDDEEVQKFCAEVGVKRQVFKVWMHNNKNNVKKQQPEPV
ncbi:zinc-finger homeodomain protein 5-like [Mangifera indica]|uniref:zinc-finger homeodomain protein 5-like n=1 Tax=Mangifera indica TaxID=29780 RepID=UPI001CFB9460|nr:zinc-finger homeodomain protein 5-like [Mangifera indica]XP_044510008.1 zinc-finger homeodomain protein 5-like [Mangifera indica]XP_044510009.1 zinc-finger homeodomain protein 5-like [Mangifera indica]XP_044510010.1 zinc-finger homeodomain protein 5-like [Mangifera indica]XP_044510011.1 zinc-finger homeodomain protein 5-like [Mangifera indica]